MPDFDFDKLKDQAEKYVKDHPDQVRKVEEMAKERLGNLFGGKDDKAQEHKPAVKHEGQPSGEGHEGKPAGEQGDGKG
jgi:hypothetical protein